MMNRTLRKIQQVLDKHPFERTNEEKEFIKSLKFLVKDIFIDKLNSKLYELGLLDKDFTPIIATTLFYRKRKNINKTLDLILDHLGLEEVNDHANCHRLEKKKVEEDK